MKKLSKKHWIALLGVVILGASTLILPIRNLGTIIPVLETLVCLIIIRIFLKESFKEYGLYFSKLPTQIFSGIILSAIILYLVYGNHIYMSISEMLDRFLNIFPTPLSIFLYILNIFLYVLPEEVVYRGILINFFQKLFRYPFITIFLSALLFGISHYPASHNWDNVMFTFVFGFVFSYLRVKEPENVSLLSLIIAHFLYNVSLAFINVPY